MAVPRAKKNKAKKFYISEKELETIKQQIAREATKKAISLTVCATADELKLNEEKIFRIAVRTDRYAENLDKHIIKINNLSKSIKDNTGIDWGLF